LNRQLPHVLVLPEDDANRQIAFGFRLQLGWEVQDRIRVLPPAGGWLRVLEAFESEHFKTMERHANRFMVLLIDFDEQVGRLESVRKRIPRHIADRAFILGAWNEPEGLKSAGLGSYGSIGSDLAKECREDGYSVWSHELLRHNADELARLRERVRPILF
jgi:hypothetical protein